MGNTLRRAVRYFRSRPWWAQTLLALAVAGLVWWVTRAVAAGVGAFVTTLLGGNARPLRRPLGPARDVGRVEGDLAAEAGHQRNDAADLRRRRDDARARDALAEESIARDARRAADAVPPAPEAGPAPRSEAIERWLERGGR